MSPACPSLVLPAALAALLLVPARSLAEAPTGPAVSALVFEEQLDGKCQILSEGGKLVVLRNTHADSAQAIRYRLVRMFLGVPQGRIDGQIAPADGPQKLGCNRVNGRRQYWRVERASLVPPSPEERP